MLNNPVVLFLLTTVYSLIGVAELVHDGQAQAGDAKKQYVLAQLSALLDSPPPVIPNVPPVVLQVLFMVLKATLPLFGGVLIDKAVAAMNSSPLFTNIDHVLESVLGLLVGTASVTPTAPTVTSPAQ
jgi:hypothetical protein